MVTVPRIGNEGSDFGDSTVNVMLIFAGGMDM
jgi:hypothetical protein